MPTLHEVNEKSTLIVTASFFDDTGAAVTPSAATYRIHDKASGTIIVATTSLSGLSTTKDIEVTSTQNALINQSDNAEEHILTLEFTYNTTRLGTSEYRWAVRGLEGVS